MARRRLEVATPDIGRTAALALVEGLPRGKKQVIELAGPVEASGNDVQAALRTITGKDINVVAGPLDAVVSTFTGFGISKEVAELFRELYAGVISGRVDFAGGDARKLRGTVTVEQTLRRLIGT
jgi:uncharacterized protein YbjT (DUF2867 family)